MCDILEAYEGHREELRVVHGKMDADEDQSEKQIDPETGATVQPATTENLKAAFRGLMTKH